MVVKYEDLKTNPKICLKKICKFLKIEFNNNMINPNKYYDFVTKKKWIPHSAFSTKFPKQDNKPIHQWKKYLSDIEVKSIELLCENEMSSMGYKFKFRKNEKNFDKVIQFIKKNYNKKVNWRTDLMDFKKDRYIEHVRYKILNNKIKVNNKLMQKCFLFNNHSLSSLIKHYKEQ
jgi:dTDP-D-glucose 4,6-dehydratase